MHADDDGAEKQTIADLDARWSEIRTLVHAQLIEPPSDTTVAAAEIDAAYARFNEVSGLVEHQK